MSTILERCCRRSLLERELELELELEPELAAIAIKIRAACPDNGRKIREKQNLKLIKQNCLTFVDCRLNCGSKATRVKFDMNWLEPKAVAELLLMRPKTLANAGSKNG